MTLVLTHGVFDLPHLGHIEHFREAKEFGDWLVVSVVPDEFIIKDRPIIYDESTRVAILSAIKYVDEVSLCGGPGPEKLIEQIRPDVYVRGYDYIGQRRPESEILDLFGIPTRYTKSVYPRTTEIIARIRYLPTLTE